MGDRSLRSLQLVATDPGTLALAQVLDHQLGTVVALENGVLRQLDVELLHDFRVAIRRTRSVISLAKNELPDDLLHTWTPEWAWLAALTSDARDLDVLLDDIEATRPGLPSEAKVGLDELAEVVIARRGATQEELRIALTGERYRTLTREWRAGLGELALSPRTGDTAADLGRHLVAKAANKAARRAASVTPESPAESIHDLRKRTKRLRYALELFRDVLPKKKTGAMIKETKRLQDDLGTFQDNEVHRRLVGPMLDPTAGPSADALAAGRLLLGRYDQRGETARRALGHKATQFAKATRRACT